VGIGFIVICSWFLVYCSWLKTFVVLGSLFLVVSAFAANKALGTKNLQPSVFREDGWRRKTFFEVTGVAIDEFFAG
jgi:hypothetical protein